MKNLFANIMVFAALSLALSSLSGCKTDAPTQNSATTNNVVADVPSNPNVESKESKYPPVPTGLYQATVKDLEGNSYKLEDKKGKVVLVNLWAIWCGPCIAEMPHLIEMQEKYRDKGFEVVGLNTGNDSGETESVENIKEFVAEKKLNYTIGYADEAFFSEMIKLTRMAAIPQSIIINRDGKMTGIFKGGGQRVINEMKLAVDKTMNE